MFSKRKPIHNSLKKLPEPKLVFNDMIDDSKNNNMPAGPSIQPNLAAEGLKDSTQKYKMKTNDFINNIDLEIDNIFDSITNDGSNIEDLNNLDNMDILTRKLSDGQRKTYEYLTEMHMENISNGKLINIAKMFGNNTTGAINYLMFDDPDDSNIAEPDFLTEIERSSKVNKNDLVMKNIKKGKSITLMGMNEQTNMDNNMDDDGDMLNINNNKQTLMGYAENMNNNSQENIDNIDNIRMINQTSVTLMGVAKGQINVCDTNIIQKDKVTLMGFCDKNQKLNVNNLNKK